MAQIEFVNVTKKYDDFIAVDNVSFEIQKGEFVFIIGHSGAGKSTLVKMLIREENPDDGDILYEGQSILNIDQKTIPALRRNIGVVFQDFKILDSKSVFENVAVALEVANTPAHVINEVVPNVLHLVGLEKKIDSLPQKLSGGEKQRLSIARALAHEPNVLVADEPTGMIDPLATDDVMSILEKVNKLGTTIIMATHDQNIVDKMKKRVIKIEGGKIVSDKTHGNYLK